MFKKFVALTIALFTLICSASVVSFAKTPFAKGDVDGDGEITTTDFLKIKNFLLGASSFDESIPTNADFDEDGEITATDYINIKLLWLSASDEANPEESFEEAASQDTSEAVSEEESENDASAESVNKTITLYVPDYENESLKTYRAYYDGTPEGIINALAKMNTLPKETAVLGFEIKDNTACFDLSEEFGIALNNARTSEWLFIASLANTVIDCYGTEYFFFTIKGEILETGLNIYDSPIEFTKIGTIYVPNNDYSDIVERKTIFNGTAEGIISKFITAGILPEETKLYSFEIKEDKVVLDLSKEFGITLNNARTSEHILIGSIANTFIDFYDVDYFEFTVEGKILETGLNIYDSPIEFTQIGTIYIPNDDYSDIVNYKTVFNGTAEGIISKFITAGILPEDTKLYSFEIKGNTIILDFSEEFGIALNDARTFEHILIGSVANTFIDFYDVDYFEFTVEGKILETGLNIYDSPIEFYSLA